MTSEIEVVIEDLRVMIQKLMVKEGVSKYDLEIEGQTANGENYTGIIIFFRVLSRSSEKVYNLVMKTGKRSEDFRKVLKPEKAYLRELFMYSDVFPAFRKFIEEKNSKIELDMILKAYWICTEKFNETVILENLKSDGYKMLDRKKTWNLEHSLFAMRKYGTYHGISIALRDQKPEIFKKLIENLTVDVPNDDDYSEGLNIFKNEVAKNIELLKKSGRSDLARKFDGFVDGIKKTLIDRAEINDRLVISHGDCWNNNFMFKYQDEDFSKPSMMRFLDFQGSIMISPVEDLSYNIYSSCDRSNLNQLDLLLETYYSSLSNTIRNLGSNPEKLFTYEQLRQHWKKYSKYGLLTGTSIMKVLLVNAEDAPDVAKLLEEGKEFKEILDFKLDREEYNRRILDMYTHYAETVL